MNIKELEMRLHTACLAWLGGGGRIDITNNSFLPNGDDDKTCRCPLGALDDSAGTHPTYIAGAMHGEALLFVEGFDSPRQKGSEPLRKLGRKFNRMYAGKQGPQ